MIPHSLLSLNSMRSWYSDIVKHSLFSMYIDNKEKHWQRGGRFVYSVVLLRGKANSSPVWEQIPEGCKKGELSGFHRSMKTIETRWRNALILEFSLDVKFNCERIRKNKTTLKPYKSFNKFYKKGVKFCTTKSNLWKIYWIQGWTANSWWWH